MNVLHKDLKSQPNAVSVARGLIPFCMRALELRIGRRIVLLDNMLSHHTDNHINASDDSELTTGHESLYTMVALIMETIAINTRPARTRIPACDRRPIKRVDRVVGDPQTRSSCAKGNAQTVSRPGIAAYSMVYQSIRVAQGRTVDVTVAPTCRILPSYPRYHGRHIGHLFHGRYE
jgi:hypothetical protein